MNNQAGYYYLHTNGDLIYKPAIAVGDDPNYFDSSFVRKVWSMNPKDRGTAYQLLIDAQAMGAKQDRIQELKIKWKITEEDTQVFANKTGFLLSMDGDQWFARCPNFENLQESPVGFGDTRWDALVDLCINLKKERR